MKLRRPRRRQPPYPSGVGAIVCGGCYLGLGIVRSLGQAGVPVCVVAAALINWLGPPRDH
jgi:hypothetical protein